MKMTEEQLTALNDAATRIFLNAGPGAGKTFTVACMAVRWASRIARGKVLILTLTNFAAQQTRLAINRVLNDRKILRQIGGNDDVGNKIECCTIHSFALRTLHRTMMWIAPVEDEINHDILITALKQERRAWLGEPKIQSRLLKIHRTGRIPKQSKMPGMPIRYVTEIMDAMKSEKHRKGITTFSDLLLMFDSRLKQESFQRQIQSEYPVMVADEFQDMGVVPWRILKRMVGKNTQFIVAGDDGQVIYTFADASFKRFDHFNKKYRGAAQISLTKNFRSTAQIQALSDALLSQSRYATPRETIAMREGPKPVLAACGGVSAMSNYIVRKIKIEKVGRDRMAIFYRHGRDAFHLREMLYRHKISYRLFGDKKSRDTPFVRLFFAFAELIEQSRPYSETWELVLGQLPGVGEKKIYGILDWLDTRGTETRYPGEPKFANDLEKLLTLVAELKIPAMENTTKVKRIVDFIRSLPKVNNSRDDFIVPTLLKLAEENTSLSKMRELYFDPTYPMYFPAKENPAPDEKYLTLSNTHKIKGGEYDVVFHLGAVDELFINNKSFEKKRTTEEELHVLRVAATRACSKLYLALPIDRATLAKGGDVPNPWRFLRGCPRKTFQVVSP